MFVDNDYLCNDPWTVGAHEPSDDGEVIEWSDSDDDGVPDYADCDSDSDSDGLVDAVEAAPPSVQPCAPGISSYGTSTDPLDPDTDSDGSTDGLDNCPLVSNPGQQNADNQIGNGKGIAGHDKTVPNSAGDLEGDACETDGDIDNDGLPNISDSDRGGDITYDDNNDGTMCPAGGADDGPSWDSDCNGVRDSMEGSCPLAVNPNGDDDVDGLLNTWEVCKWGTDPAVLDSDGDGKGDCKEAADVDGNSAVNFTGDVIFYAKAILLAPAAFGRDGDFDIDGNNVVNFPGDVIQEAKFGLLAGRCK
jgi:hypothetical protein